MYEGNLITGVCILRPKNGTDIF